MMKLKPTTIAEVQDIVQQTQQPLRVCGGGTKAALSTAGVGEKSLEMGGLTGMISYEPSEYTFTAYAGTPSHQIKRELGQHGQYLPFDPILIKQGSTLAGVVAANSCGSGRYRYGGVRDFILGIRFVDGLGRLVSSGGGVVKNAAGFDLSKFMVGSLGRYGVLLELSFKIFPQPSAYATLMSSYATVAEVVTTLQQLATSPFACDAVDIMPALNQPIQLAIRLGGLSPALPSRLNRLQTFLQQNRNAQSIEILPSANEALFWQSNRECEWVQNAPCFVKVPLPLKKMPAFDQVFATTNRRYTNAGNIAWLAGFDKAEIEQKLISLGLVGLQLWGEVVPGTQSGQPILGRRKGLALAQRVKQALDPLGKFGKTA